MSLLAGNVQFVFALCHQISLFYLFSLSLSLYFSLYLFSLSLYHGTVAIKISRSDADCMLSRAQCFKRRAHYFFIFTEHIIAVTELGQRRVNSPCQYGNAEAVLMLKSLRTCKQHFQTESLSRKCAPSCPHARVQHKVAHAQTFLL